MEEPLITPNYIQPVELKDRSETDNDSKTSPMPTPVSAPAQAPAPAQTTPPTQNLDMRSERARLSTFVNWPLSFMLPKDLAKAGFFYTQMEDVVRCAFCGVEIGRWEIGDNPMNDHHRWSNQCPFVRSLDVGNVPIGEDDGVELPTSASRDTCGRYGVEFRPNSVEERAGQNIDWKRLGVTPCKGPTHPQYSTLEARLRTFREWPMSLKQTPNELAEAGFFYTGKGDQTLCFSCGGGLKDWLASDVPWEQHARWFTKCSYVLMCKGHEYVSEVSNRLPAVVTPQQGAEIVAETEHMEAVTPQINTVTPSPSTSSNGPAPAPAPAPPALEKHVEKMDDARLCKICYNEELGVVFLPCGHIVACVKCAPSLKLCAVCRQPFTATVRAFLS